MSDRDPHWFKDAIFYQLHVKAFMDSDNDGMGDFKGLTERLDHVQALGCDTVWLLPFYPSPLRDDGYDIADYRNVNPAYGSMEDFRAFVQAAHERGLRVITELVVNHTSDQHPWFQRARKAPPGSPERNYYVWSDDDTKYAGTRIIFTDTEKSNWAWDEEAGAYYWHRFFSHQPDLNYDNPEVVREVVEAMRFWLDLGVDGMRLDAVPYLCEREGTNNENIPETHAILRQLRAALDESHPGCIFIAEANQWPEDVLPYFGEGDECHMAFHFPLMPRMYMAIAREDRHPITDIMRQTPEIPDGCQWGIFLRNHDELTLEMVTDRERDYLWSTYAADPRMRVNVGIRRRLAPLMDSDRRKLELLNSLLLSMPGTPIIYYGDELGMGDNIYLGDRNGVRTPMQWSEDRNGGFSRADPARLYLPPIMDPVYGYRAVNVEAQARSPSSLLNWMRRIISVRRSRKTFGRGSLRFLYPANRKVLAYLREYEGEAILCVANLSAAAQGVELDMAEFRGRVPVEMSGNSAFPPVGDLPYFLTLPGYGFFWFLLTEEAAPGWHEPMPQTLTEFSTLVLRDGWTSLLAGGSRRVLEQEVLPAYFRHQRWFADKDSRIAGAEVLRHAELRVGEDAWMITLVAVTRGDGLTRHYCLPLAAVWGNEAEDMLANNPAQVLSRLRLGARVGALYDATFDPAFARAAWMSMRQQVNLLGSNGQIACTATRALTAQELAADMDVRRLSAEQSNTSIMIGRQAILKIIRRPEEGVSVEVEMGRFLTETAGYANTPPLLGSMMAVDDTGRPTTLAVMHGFVENQGDAWSWATDHLLRTLDPLSIMTPDEIGQQPDPHGDFLGLVGVMGLRTGEMHRALALSTGDHDFDPQPVEAEDVMAWERRLREGALAAIAAVRDSSLPGAMWLRDNGARLMGRISDLVPRAPRATKTRVHGDLHLGQVLVSKNDFYIIDFEGEPARALADRRARDLPVRDVAGMLRSFDYAAGSVLCHLEAVRAGSLETLEPHAYGWARRCQQAFLEQWMRGVHGSPVAADTVQQFDNILKMFVLEKACYEVTYEAANRPGWLPIPLRGLKTMLEEG